MADCIYRKLANCSLNNIDTVTPVVAQKHVLLRSSIVVLIEKDYDRVFTVFRQSFVPH
jgi:hypothetical protein